MMSIYKKLGLSFVLVGALGVSANADMCMADRGYCINLYIGGGGFYENISGDGANINNTLGFVSLGGSDVYFDRLQFAIDAKFGYGSNSVGGTKLSSISKDNDIFQLDAIGKIGVNVAGKNSPLFINLIMGYDIMRSRNGVGRDLMMIGGGLDGKIALSEKTNITYSAGYAYAFSGSYYFGRTYTKADEFGHIIMFSLGAQTKVSENVSLYIKGLGKYYDLHASSQVMINNADVSMPKSNGWQAGLEAGIAF